MAFIQARMGSSRHPGKVLELLAGKPVLQRIVERLRLVRPLDGIAVLTPDTPADVQLRRFAENWGVDVFAGNEDDVLDRFQAANRHFAPDAILRVTADCPLLDPSVVTDLIEMFHREEPDYAAVATTPALGFRRFPDGLDAEVFSAAVLSTACEEARDPEDREHVTPFIWRHPERFEVAILEAESDWGNERWTVDYPDDLAFVQAIYERLENSSLVFGYRDVLALLDREPALRNINRQHAG